MIYLFTGEDELSKQERITSLKKELFPSDTESFNYDAFYAKELTLPLFKELLSRLPVSSRQRLLVIKDALKLKPDIQEYILSRIPSASAKEPHSRALDLPDHTVIVLSVSDTPKGQNIFWGAMARFSKQASFKSKPRLSAFDLARAIERKNAEVALNMLADLFALGESPERILGALRYQFIRPEAPALESKNTIRLLLETDNNLKTGRIKGVFALEALVVGLCRNLQANGH